MTDRASLLALEQIGIKLGLAQIRALLDALSQPDRAFPSLVIAGTNGKGSVTAMVERALRAAGYRTGRYTSPHLVALEERVAIDGASIAPARLDALVARVMAAAGTLDAPPTFFEATTAIALEAFRDAGVDVAVLEVGLGGRLDATNVVASTAVAITAVDFDHQAYLGHTLEEIAGEKAGVIKPGGLAVLGENSAVVCQVVLDVAAGQHARVVYAPEGVTVDAAMADGRLTATIDTPRTRYEAMTLGLRGRHQIANAVTAIRLLEELTAEGAFVVSPEAIRTGVEAVVWPARLELLIWRDTAVLIDGAHNPAGARALASYIDEAFGRTIPIVIGAMRDKQLDGMMAALAPVAAHFVCTAPRSPRAATPEDIADVARRVAPHVPVIVAARPLAALEAAAAMGSPVAVAGSLYLAGEIRAELS